MSSGAWLKTSGSHGVTKRKGSGTSVTKRCISTRNRLKVERLRESLNDLHLEEKESAATRNKACKNASRLQVQLRDVQFSDEGTCTGISVLTGNPISLGVYNPILKRQNRGKHTAVRSAMKKVSFDCAHQSGEDKSKSDFSGEFFQIDNDIQTDRIIHNSGVSFCCIEEADEFLSSASADNVDYQKRKYDKPLLHAFVSLKDFKGTKKQPPFSAGVCVFDSGKTFNDDLNDDDNRDDGGGNDSPMHTNQYSPSPPNSPLYDMPPPSTHAQKQARRAKRHLQLDRWRKFEASKSRQERYQRRVQESARSIYKSVLDSRRVKWSIDLVNAVYIDDI